MFNYSKVKKNNNNNSHNTPPVDTAISCESRVPKCPFIFGNYKDTCREPDTFDKFSAILQLVETSKSFPVDIEFCVCVHCSQRSIL